MITIAEDKKGPTWEIEGIHGRKDELKLLNKIADGDFSSCVLMEGCQGCGKTTLLQAVDWEEKGWVLIAHKFEEHLSSEPYSALTRAVDELVEIWCTNNEKSRDGDKMSELLDVLENDMDLLKAVVPGLFKVIDKFAQKMNRSRSRRMLLASKKASQINMTRSPTMSRRNLLLKAQSSSFVSRSSNANLQKSGQKSGPSASVRNHMSTRSPRSPKPTLRPSMLGIGQPSPGNSRRSDAGSIGGLRELTGRRQHRHAGNEKLGGDSAAVASSFLKLFSFLSTTNPVVLSLDDVHFADASSMEILKLMAESAANKSNAKSYSGHIFLVMTYSELLEQYQFASRTIENIKTLKSNVHHLDLKNWDVDTINDLVSTLVKTEPEESLPLAEVIHKKTAGNPYEVSQFLRFAREKGHFTFSSMTYRWQWEDVKVLDEYAAVADNVAEILAASMISLPYATKSALKVASCLGNTIPQDVLVEYFSERNTEENTTQEDRMVELLDEATQAGILVKSREQGAFMWSNSRLQQAAYESMSPTMRNRLHLTLGRLLWELGMVRDLEWMIFMAANQMNKYSELQADASLGNEVAELNLQAAILSLNKGAIYPALELLEKAEEHMEVSDGWTEAYELTLDIMTTLAETKLRVGEIDTAMILASEVVQNSTTHDDTFPAHIIMLECIVSGNDRNYQLGVEKTLWLLEFYGEDYTWKFYPGQEKMQKAKLKSKIKKLLPGGELEGLLDLSDMVDMAELRIQTLLVNHLAVYASYCPTYKYMSWFASARALKSACKRGISPVTNLALIQLASHMRIEGQYREAGVYAEVALVLTDCLPRSLGSDHGQVRMIACGSVFSASRSFNHCLNELLGCRTDFLKAGLAKESIAVAIGYTITYMCVGLSIAAARSDLTAHTADAKQYGCPYTVEQKMRILHQTIVNLMDNVEKPTILSGEVMDQDEEIDKVEGLGALRVRLRMNACRLMLCCVFCDWYTAEALIDDLEENGDDQDGFLMRSHFRRCYVGLAAFAVSRVATNSKKRKKYHGIGNRQLKSFKKEMKFGSVNAFPIVTMLEAEKNPSKESYDLAIKACARLGLVHHEAYLCERCAEMFRTRKDTEWCCHYISQAILLYGEWGATGKVSRLTKEYEEALEGSNVRDSVNTSLQSRCRYSSKELDALRRVDWKTFNKGTTEPTELDDSFMTTEHSSTAHSGY